MSNGSRLIFEDVSNRLLNMIFVEKRFQPNDRLPNETKLAEELGVGRTSVREAVKILAARGVLKVKQGKGTFVSENPEVDPDPFALESYEDKKKLLFDWYETRLIVEPEAARLASERATEEEIEEISRLERQTADLIAQGKNYLNSDHALHTAIAKASHNVVLRRIIPALQLSAFKGYAPSSGIHLTPQVYADTLHYHREICSFLQKRDGIGASLAMRQHLLLAIKNIVQQINKTG